MRRRRFLHVGAMSAAGALAGTFAAARSHPKANVVIAGGGFAGASCALNFRRLNRAINVTLIDPEEPYVTCPMSNEVMVGLRSFESIMVPRAGLRRAGVSFVRDEVKAIDASQRRVRLGSGATLSYDRLIVAPGIRFLRGTPEGYDEAAALRMPHAWQAGTQTKLLTEQLRSMPDGGVVAISVPRMPFRCPPGPYERASLIAYFLAAKKPRSKILIFDANNQFPRQETFIEAWRSLYPGLIDWIPVTEGGAVLRVESEKNILYTAQGAHSVAVANIIPPQAPATLALDAGLATGHGWCPIKPSSFESLLVENVHVIGDACIADAMPKAASAAVSQARQCALAIVAALEGREPPQPSLHSACYSLIAPRYGLEITATFQVLDGQIRRDDRSPHVDSAESTQAAQQREAQQAYDWYQSICGEAFGA